MACLNSIGWSTECPMLIERLGGYNGLNRGVATPRAKSSPREACTPSEIGQKGVCPQKPCGRVAATISFPFFSDWTMDRLEKLVVIVMVTCIVLLVYVILQPAQGECGVPSGPCIIEGVQMPNGCMYYRECMQNKSLNCTWQWSGMQNWKCNWLFGPF